MQTIDSKNLDTQFKYDVAAHPGGENIKLCFACGTCTAGCPVSAVDPDFNPRKIIRQVLLGMRQEVLSSPVIWRCVQCYSCTAKCPQNVVEQLDEFSQKLRRDLVNVLVTDPGRFESIKDNVEKTATA